MKTLIITLTLALAAPAWADCIRNPPLIEVTPSYVDLAPGASVTFTSFVTNMNTGCSPGSWYLTPGWTGTGAAYFNLVALDFTGFTLMDGERSGPIRHTATALPDAPLGAFVDVSFLSAAAPYGHTVDEYGAAYVHVDIEIEEDEVAIPAQDHEEACRLLQCYP